MVELDSVLALTNIPKIVAGAANLRKGEKGDQGHASVVVWPPSQFVLFIVDVVCKQFDVHCRNVFDYHLCQHDLRQTEHFSQFSLFKVFTL